MPPSPLADLPERTDVAIIGAGYTGLAAALTLAKSGAAVTVVEAEDVGWGASSRNAGMVLSGLKRGPQELVARFGPETARRFDAASIAAIGTVAQIVRDEAIDCDFKRCGHIALASKPNHADALRRDGDIIEGGFGRPVRFIERGALGDEVGSTAFWGGLADDASASLHPAKYVAGLARAARGAGATICTKARVDAIATAARDGSGAFRLTTSRGAVTSAEVVVATGGYTGPPFSALQGRVLRIGSYVIATAPLAAGKARALIPRDRVLFDSKHLLHYFRLTPDGRFLFGGRASFVPESGETIDRSASILRRDMLRMFPQLADESIDRVWGGTIDFTYDIMPHAGRADGMHFALGYAGHGVAMATHLGTLVARSVLGQPVDELFTAQLPAAPLGLHRGVQWFMPAAGAWLKLLDAVS